MRPLVSVVCACFNISKYLDEAIASIYAQGYPNLELIVVDDGSTDDTYERLAMLRERHGFQLYRQANRGVSDALNHGLRHARGEFVMTPDLDDIVLPGALDTRVDYLLAHPEVGCVGGFNICIDSAGNEVARDGFSEGCVERWGFDAALAETLVVMPLTALYHMEAMRRADFFDPSIRVQDFQITLRTRRRAMKFIDCRPTWGVIAGMEAVCPAGTSSITRRICKPSSLIGLTRIIAGPGN